MPEPQRARQAELLLITDSVALRSVASTQPEASRAERSGYDLALEWRRVHEEGGALETICQVGDAGQAEALKGVNVRDRTWQEPLPTGWLERGHKRSTAGGGGPSSSPRAPGDHMSTIMMWIEIRTAARVERTLALVTPPGAAQVLVGVSVFERPGFLWSDMMRLRAEDARGSAQ